MNISRACNNISQEQNEHVLHFVFPPLGTNFAINEQQYHSGYQELAHQGENEESQDYPLKVSKGVSLQLQSLCI